MDSIVNLNENVKNNPIKIYGQSDVEGLPYSNDILNISGILRLPTRCVAFMSAIRAAMHQGDKKTNKKPNKKCWMGQPTLALLTGQTVPTLKAGAEDAENAGLIESQKIFKRGGGYNYRYNFIYPWRISVKALHPLDGLRIKMVKPILRQDEKLTKKTPLEISVTDGKAESAILYDRERGVTLRISQETSRSRDWTPKKKILSLQARKRIFSLHGKESFPCTEKNLFLNRTYKKEHIKIEQSIHQKDRLSPDLKTDDTHQQAIPDTDLEKEKLNLDTDLEKEKLNLVTDIEEKLNPILPTNQVVKHISPDDALRQNSHNSYDESSEDFFNRCKGRLYKAQDGTDKARIKLESLDWFESLPDALREPYAAKFKNAAQRRDNPDAYVRVCICNLWLKPPKKLQAALKKTNSSSHNSPKPDFKESVVDFFARCKGKKYAKLSKPDQTRALFESRLWYDTKDEVFRTNFEGLVNGKAGVMKKSSYLAVCIANAWLALTDLEVSQVLIDAKREAENEHQCAKFMSDPRVDALCPHEKGTPEATNWKTTKWDDKTYMDVVSERDVWAENVINKMLKDAESELQEKERKDAERAKRLAESKLKEKISNSDLKYGDLNEDEQQIAKDLTVSWFPSLSEQIQEAAKKEFQEYCARESLDPDDENTKAAFLFDDGYSVHLRETESHRN